jgi:hypothetical protein
MCPVVLFDVAMATLADAPADPALDRALARWRGIWLRMEGPPRTWRATALAHRIRQQLTDPEQIREFREWRLRRPPRLTAAEIDYVVAQRARLATMIDLDALRDYVVALTNEAAEARFDLDRQDAAFIERDVAEDLLRRVRGAWFQGDPVLHRDHLRELRSSTISRASALAAGLWSEPDARIVSSILNREMRGGALYLVYPYRRPGRPRAEFFRVKRTGSRPRYLQPRRTPTGIFYPPGALAGGGLQDTRRPLIVVEGEKKALALDRMGYSVIGLPGVWCAHDKAARKATRTLRLHAWIREDVVVQGRTIVVCFDANIRKSGDVRRAAERTAKMFIEAGAADVRIVPWAAAPPRGVNGVDDLAAELGDDAVNDLIASAVPTLPPFDIEVPLDVAAAPGLTATQKLAFGALAARASRGLARRITLDELAVTLDRSAEAVGRTLRLLHSNDWELDPATELVRAATDDDGRRDHHDGGSPARGPRSTRARHPPPAARRRHGRGPARAGSGRHDEPDLSRRQGARHAAPARRQRIRGSVTAQHAAQRPLRARLC